MQTPKDLVIRAMTDDSAFRAITARTTAMVQGVLDSQQTPTACRQVMGDLLTAAVLIRETMSPDQRLQALLTDKSRKSRLVADAHLEGQTRGLVTLRKGQDTLSLKGGQLEVQRTMYSGQPHRGLVEIPPGGGVNEAVMAYMDASEQVASMVAVATVMAGDRVQVAGGYIIQLLPEVGRAPLTVMTERLRDFATIETLLPKIGGDPVTLLKELLYGMPYTMLQTDGAVSFACQCSTVRVLRSLATIGREEIASMVAEGKAIDINCDYCGQAYSVSPKQLGGLLDEN